MPASSSRAPAAWLLPTCAVAFGALGLLGCQPQGGRESIGQTQQADDGNNQNGPNDDGSSKSPAKALKKAPNPKWTDADDAILAPVWAGNDDHGALYTPLWRGAFPGLEDLVYTPPGGDCRKIKGTVRVDWDSAANTVHFLIKARGLPPHPVVTRTEGVDWWPDAFHNAPKDAVVSAYRLWVIRTSTTHKINFYYNPANLQLLGSEYDFPGGAPSPVAIQVPALALTDSLTFDVGADGYISHEWTVAYDQVTGEGGTFSHAYGTFAPIDLCQAAPLQPDISQLRPYTSQWQPPSKALKWTDFMHGGIGFDLQIDDASNPYIELGGHLPYIFSGISVAGNVTALRGGVPNGQSLSIVAAFRNVTPPIEPVVGGNGLGCSPFVFEPHVTAPLYCQGQH